MKRGRGLAVVIFGLGLTLAGCSSPPADTPDTPQQQATEPFTVNGTFTYGMGNATKDQFPEGTPCDFDDPITGRQVTVSDQSGDVVATGRIGAGRTTWAANQGECVYQLNVSDVPPGHKFYKLAVNGFDDTDYVTASELDTYQWKALRS